MMIEENVPLPETTEELAGFAEFDSHWLTINRDAKGSIYLVDWFHHNPLVLAAIRPDHHQMKTDEAIVALDEDTLLGIVMKLTGGSANPSVVLGQIERVRSEVAERAKLVSTETKALPKTA